MENNELNSGIAGPIDANRAERLTDTVIVWSSSCFSEMPLTGWNNEVNSSSLVDERIKIPFSYTLVNLDELVDSDKTLWSLSHQGRSTLMAPVMFKDDNGEVFFYFGTKGQGKTVSDLSNSIRGTESAINKSFSYRNKKYSQNVKDSSVRGASDLDGELADMRIAEFLLSKHYQTARPVLIMNRNDQVALDINKISGYENFHAGIYVRAFKSPYRLQHLGESKKFINIIDQEKKLLKLRGLKAETNEDIVNHFFNVLSSNLSIMHDNKVCYRNWNFQNTCINGETVDFDNVAIYGKDDHTILDISCPDADERKVFENPKEAWEDHFYQLFSFFEDIRWLMCAMSQLSDKPTITSKLEQVYLQNKSSSLSPNQRVGFDRAVAHYVKECELRFITE